MVLEWWRIEEAAGLWPASRPARSANGDLGAGSQDAVRSTMSIYLGGSFQIVDFEPA